MVQIFAKYSALAMLPICDYQSLNHIHSEKVRKFLYYPLKQKFRIPCFINFLAGLEINGIEIKAL